MFRLLLNHFSAKSADRRGRSCAGPQTMFDIFLKRLGQYFRTGPQTMFDIFLRGWDIILGPAQDRPLRSAEDGVAIFNIFKIRVELMYISFEPHYFMPKGQFYALAIFVMGRL